MLHKEYAKQREKQLKRLLNDDIDDNTLKEIIEERQELYCNDKFEQDIITIIQEESKKQLEKAMVTHFKKIFKSIRFHNQI